MERRRALRCFAYAPVVVLCLTALVSMMEACSGTGTGFGYGSYTSAP